MRTIVRASLLCALALCIVGATAWVTAGDGVDVMFYDADGQLLTGNNIFAVVMEPDGSAMDRQFYPASPDGIYDIDASPGQRVMFEVIDEAELNAYGVVKIEIPGDLTGTLPVTVQGIPPNDDCANAIPVAVGGVIAGETLGATIDAADECPVDQGPAATVTAPGVWYTTIGTGGQMNATTCPSVDPMSSATYDSKISIYCLGCAELQCVKGNDDQVGCSQVFRSNVTWCSQAGIEYHILVHGFAAQTGMFNLAVNDLGPCQEPAVDCTPPQPEGACCTCLAEPFNCQQTTAEECAALTGNLGGTPGIGYQGDDTECFTTGTTSTTYPSGPVGTPFVVTASNSIVVPDATLIGDLDVDVVIDHTWVGDIVLDLTHVESGTTVRLIDQPGVPATACGCPSNNYDIVLDDEGTGGAIENVCPGGDAQLVPPSPPNYVPQNPLAAFDGQLASGTWTLTVTDAQPAFDDGTFQSWALIVTAGTPTCSEFTGCGGGGGGGGGDCPGDEDEASDDEDEQDDEDDESSDHEDEGDDEGDDEEDESDDDEDDAIFGVSGQGNQAGTPGGTVGVQTHDNPRSDEDENTTRREGSGKSRVSPRR